MRLPVLAVLVSLAGCTRAAHPPPDAAPPPVDASTPDSSSAPARPNLVTALGADLDDASFARAQWTATGAVVTILRDRFWWFRPDDPEHAAYTTPTPAPDGAQELVVARDAEVAVVTAGAGIHAKETRAYVFRAGRLASTFPVTLQAHAVRLSDDGSLLLVSNLAGDEVYDVATGARRDGAALARATPDPTRNTSRDGKLTLDTASPGVRIVDGSGREIAMWGLRRITTASRPLVVSLVDEGLDVFTGQELTRIGPRAPAHRAPPRSAAAQSAGGVARDGARLLVEDAGTLTFRDRGTRHGATPIGETIEGASFLEPNAAVVLAGSELIEMALPSLAITARHRVDLPPMDLGRPSVMGTPRSIVAVRSTLAAAKGLVVPRSGDAAEPVRFHAWNGGALVWRADGRVHVFGDAETALFCLDETTGIARPFAACRALYEATEPFRIE